jgi:hypothetical protein
VGDTLVFPRQINKSELQGTTLVRTWHVAEEGSGWGVNVDCYGHDADGNYSPRACTYHTGYRYCSQLTRVDGTMEAEVCQGAFYKCDQDASGSSSCVEVPHSSVTTEVHSYGNQQHRYWSHYELSVLDLSNPSAPVLRPKLTMPEQEEAVALVEDGNRLWVNYKQPVRLPGDSRPYVRFFIKPLDLSSPANPALGAAINVPGQLLAAKGDTLLTRDFLWGQTIVESSINKLKLHNGLAYLQGTQRFSNQLVQQVVIDGLSRALVSHDLAWQACNDGNSQEQHKLSILDISGNSLSLLSTTQVDHWAQLQDVRNNRALFQVPGGLLVFNIANATAPYAQAYFPTRGWPSDLTVHNQDVYFSAGPYGLYKFDLSTDNLSLP